MAFVWHLYGMCIAIEDVIASRYAISAEIEFAIAPNWCVSCAGCGPRDPAPLLPWAACHPSGVWHMVLPTSRVAVERGWLKLPQHATCRPNSRRLYQPFLCFPVYVPTLLSYCSDLDS